MKEKENVYERGLRVAGQMMTEREEMLVEAAGLLKKAVSGKLHMVDVSRAQHFVGRVTRMTKKV